MTFQRTGVRALLLAFSSAATLSVAISAAAQTAPPYSSPQVTPDEPAAKTEGKISSTTTEVVVTGYRASLQNALTAKRNSDLPIESIAPEDIGKMPDQNVAESLQRLPGVQIDRGSAGEGTSVLIDGLRQNLTTLNGDVFLTGKEFYVSGEGAGNGAGGNAQYGSLEGIPSEEIGGIDVYKNPEASITEGGLGGTIDLKTRDPLAQPMGFSIGGNFRESFAEREPGSTPNATLVGSYKASSRFAITASISYDKEDTHTQEYEQANRNQWLVTNSATGPYTGALSPAGLSALPQYYIEPQLGYFSDIYDERQTLGAAFGLAYKISDSIKTSLNWFYSREDDVNIGYTDKTWFNGQGSSPGTRNPGIDPTQPYSINNDGVVQSAVFNANGAETDTIYQHNLSQANNVQWKTTWDNGGPLRADLDVAYAFATDDLQADQADVEHGLYDTASGVPTSPAAPGCNNGASTCTNATGSHGYEFSYSNGGTSGLPSVSYLAPFTNVLSDPAYATFKSNWAWANMTQQRNESIKADLIYEPDYMKEVAGKFTFGFRYAERDVDQVFGRYLINGSEAPGVVAGSTDNPNGGPYDYYQDPGYGTPNIPYSTATSNPALAKTVNNFGVGNIIVKNPSTMSNPSTFLDQVWGGAGVPNNTEKLFVDGLSSFKVLEDTTSGYAMGDIGSPSNRFHMNFGVRITQTNLTINNGQSAATPTFYGTASWNGVDSNVVPVETKRSYIDVLPSFNFVLDVTDTQKVRFGAARVVSPQDLFSLGVGNLFNFTRQTYNPGQAGARVNVNNGSNDGFAFAGGTSGNTELDPYRATQFNMSYENYFSKSGLVSVAGFYKAVDNFVETQNIPTFVDDDFGGTTADVTKPVNAGKGSIYGVELGGQYAVPSSLFPLLKGLGVAANYTRSLSFSGQTTSFSNDTPIPGVSKNAVTGTVYYERAGFNARGSYSWRDTAVNDNVYGATFAFPNQNGVSKVYQVYSAPYGQLDGQVGYDFNKHVGLVFSVQNLTDSAQHTYLQWPDQPFSYDDAGRRFFLGFKFKE